MSLDEVVALLLIAGGATALGGLVGLNYWKDKHRG